MLPAIGIRIGSIIRFQRHTFLRRRCQPLADHQRIGIFGGKLPVAIQHQRIRGLSCGCLDRSLGAILKQHDMCIACTCVAADLVVADPIHDHVGINDPLALLPCNRCCGENKGRADWRQIELEAGRGAIKLRRNNRTLGAGRRIPQQRLDVAGERHLGCLGAKGWIDQEVDILAILDAMQIENFGIIDPDICDNQAFKRLP